MAQHRTTVPDLYVEHNQWLIRVRDRIRTNTAIWDEPLQLRVQAALELGIATPGAGEGWPRYSDFTCCINKSHKPTMFL